MPSEPMPDEVPLFCARCSTALRPGAGDFYIVKIVAVADPAPPAFSEEDLTADIGQEIKRLIAQMSHVTAQESMDQVFRRVFLHLCAPCFREWIEDPARR